MAFDDLDAFEQLKWATQALALEPEQQLALFPSFVDKPFELFDDYDNFYRARAKCSRFSAGRMKRRPRGAARTSHPTGDFRPG